MSNDDVKQKLGTTLCPSDYQEMLADGTIVTRTYTKQQMLWKLRAEYYSKRAKLLRAMLERGDDYQCCHNGCEARTTLQMDHIISLSNGGTNDLSNLQFLCEHHNKRKGIK